METCILLSTCDRYADLAGLTLDLIHQRWKNHPPVFVCGMSNPFRSDVVTLLDKEDPRDWIGITESAARQLLDKGYKKCYLILDDHPPLQICNEIHLNKTLPALMDDLGAAYIGLHGWDQNTLSDGKILLGGYLWLQKQSPSFLWQYALHPALWNVQALREIAGSLPKIGDDIASRSVWAFERRSGAASSQIPHVWQGKAYRVFGLRMLGGKFSLIRGLGRRILFLLLNFMFLLSKMVFGAKGQERLIDRFIHETLFYNGPYPLYWSGVMQKGRLNKNFERYLLSHRRNDELTRLKEILPSNNEE